MRSRLRVADLPDLKAEPPVEDSTRYHWVGRDRDGAHVWWYFEIEPSDAKRPEWVDNRLLFDREPDFLHRLLILDHTPPRATNLTLNRSKVTLQDPSGDAATPDPPKPLDATDDDHAPLPPTNL